MHFHRDTSFTSMKNEDFAFQSVSRQLWDGCEISLVPWVYSYRVNLVGAFGGVSLASQGSPVMATDPEGRL